MRQRLILVLAVTAMIAAACSALFDLGYRSTLQDIGVLVFLLAV